MSRVDAESVVEMALSLALVRNHGGQVVVGHGVRRPETAGNIVR